MTESPMWMRAFLIGCLDKVPEAERHHLAELAQNELMPEHNSALKYYEGAVLAACEEKQIAHVFLRRAITDRYCAHQALQADPLLTAVRQDREFQEILAASAECERKFTLAEGNFK